jgi:hypothetical protein
MHELSGRLSKQEVLLEALSSLYYPTKASFSLGPQQAQTISCSSLPLQPKIDIILQTVRDFTGGILTFKPVSSQLYSCQCDKPHFL